MNQLVTTAWLAEHLNDSDLVIADIRWVNRDSDAAYRGYLQGHIPGAVFVDTDADLSEIGDYSKGRHPLPGPLDLVERLARKGIGKGKRVVCTEEESFKLSARLWWLLRWIGVDDVLLLDGGLVKWKAEGRAISTDESKAKAVEPYDIHLRADLMVTAEQVQARVTKGAKLLDARAEQRFRGEVETIDKRAGHIEGAASLPLAMLVEGDPPRMKSSDAIRETVKSIGLTTQQSVTAYCGSGVTACQLLWGLHYAGFGNLHLYPGSWSEWIELHPEAGVEIT